jgi:hypothetical protein
MNNRLIANVLASYKATIENGELEAMEAFRLYVDIADRLVNYRRHEACGL